MKSPMEKNEQQDKITGEGITERGREIINQPQDRAAGREQPRSDNCNQGQAQYRNCLQQQGQVEDQPRANSTGTVYLVGAGPGDPGLITLRGLQCIARADVLVYDRLVSRRLLEYAPRDAEMIYVGKQPDRHAMEQGDINRLLVSEALQGRTVTRLKGGDPFVFGRGGEEALLLAENRVPFEVVPGITSAVAVPAYAGIPVTHRGIAANFSVITGHEDPAKGISDLDWASLAAGRGTRIFLMGVGNLALIKEKLVENGCDIHTPVALVRWGTLPEQETLTGTLEDIAEKAEQSGFRPPAVIVVGDVVRLREQLKWRETKPLFGCRVLVTRSREQASRLSRRIEELGGEALEFPAIEIVPPQNYSALDSAIDQLQTYRWLIFTSVNGVRYFFDRLRHLRRDIRDLQGVRLCAVGPATIRELEQRGLLVEFAPREYRSEILLQELSGQVKPGEKVLLPRGNLAWENLPQGLQEMGARVDDVVVYHTVKGTGDVAFLQKMIEDGMIHAVTFTSSSTARNFSELLTAAGESEAGTGQGLLARRKDLILASIGPTTSGTARELGLEVDVEAEEHTIEGLVDALVQAVGGPRPRPNT